MSIQNKQNGINLIFKVLQQSHSCINKQKKICFCTVPHNAPLTAKARQQYIFSFFKFFFFKSDGQKCYTEIQFARSDQCNKRCRTSGAKHGGHTRLDCIKSHCTLFYSVVSKVKKGLFTKYFALKLRNHMVALELN